MKQSLMDTFADPKHPVWELVGTVIRLGVLLVFIVVLTYLTSNNYDLVWNDEGGHDLLTFLAVGGWSEYQRRRPV
jgi:cellulose synthase/poly-beta-1,6-N-acetylglucosamine synthase-like glycosyltransferase